MEIRADLYKSSFYFLFEKVEFILELDWFWLDQEICMLLNKIGIDVHVFVHF